MIRASVEHFPAYYQFYRPKTDELTIESGSAHDANFMRALFI